MRRFGSKGHAPFNWGLIRVCRCNRYDGYRDLMVCVLYTGSHDLSIIGEIQVRRGMVCKGYLVGFAMLTSCLWCETDPRSAAACVEAHGMHDDAEKHSRLRGLEVGRWCVGWLSVGGLGSWVVGGAEGRWLDTCFESRGMAEGKAACLKARSACKCVLGCDSQLGAASEL